MITNNSFERTQRSKKISDEVYTTSNFLCIRPCAAHKFHCLLGHENSVFIFHINSTIPSYLFSHCKLRYHPLNFSQIKNKLNCHFLLVIGQRRATCKVLLVFSGLTLWGICSNPCVYLDIVLTPVQFHILLVYRLCMSRIEYKAHKALRC